MVFLEEGVLVIVSVFAEMDGSDVITRGYHQHPGSGFPKVLYHCTRLVHCNMGVGNVMFSYVWLCL